MAIKNIFSSGELFQRVQLENIFPDGKTIVDCTPRNELQVILRDYEMQKFQPGFDLTAFVNANFILPESQEPKYFSVEGRPIRQHIELLWDELSRDARIANTSLITLPHPYIVPGGRFREMFYWDSYFTMLGLYVSGKAEVIENMADNFSFLIDNYGYIPNGNRTYFLGRSQPPFYASMINLLCEAKNENVLVKYLPQLEKEYAFWMKGSEQLNNINTSCNRVAQMIDGSILNHYWDDNDFPRPESFKEDFELAEGVKDKNKLYRNIRAACESGWDFFITLVQGKGFFQHSYN